MIDPDDILAAVARIEPHVQRTAVAVSEPLSERTGTTIALKAEHRQRTGSFKIRGALNKVLGLDEGAAAGGVVTASSGNHGIGVATAASIRGVPCTVYLPRGASESKVAAIARLGAEIEEVDGTDANLAELAAREAARTSGRTYVSPYNDVDVVAGQGTIGVELLADAGPAGLPAVDAVVVSVGGGGLISGIASWVRHASPDTVVVGASPENDHAMIASITAGRIVEAPASPTLSDGTAGGIEAGAITFDLCAALVDEWVTVSELQTARAMAAMIDDHHEVVEGAAGVALAAAQAYARSHPGARIVAVTCGANVSSRTLGAALDLVRDAGG